MPESSRETRLTQRLIDQIEAAGGKCTAQIELQRTACLHLGAHVLLEEPERVAAVCFCAIQSQIGAFHQLVTGDAVLRSDGDPNANAY
jgi:hypothetical protein